MILKRNYMLFFTREILEATFIQRGFCLLGEIYNKDIFSIHEFVEEIMIDDR